MFDTHNVLAKSFRMARDKIQDNDVVDVKLKLISRRNEDARTNNLPVVFEVAVLIVGDFDESLGDIDILIESKTGHVQRISELHPSYLALQYPILFPYGEDGYKEDIPLLVYNTNATRARSTNKCKRILRLSLPGTSI